MASIIRQNIGFITAMYPSDVKIAAPYPAVNQLSGTYAAKPSSDSDTSASKACTAYDSEYRLPNTEEAIFQIGNRLDRRGALNDRFIVPQVMCLRLY